MKAVVLESFGDTTHLKLKEIPTPHPKKNEVRIKLKASGFNPVDFKIRKGEFGGQTPIVLGSDCSGTIDALGEGVHGFVQGDAVYAMPFGQCSNGSYAEYLCIPAQFVAKKPHKLSFEEAAAIPLVAMTAYRATLAGLDEANSVFIAGAGGGVGSLAIQLIKHKKIPHVFTVAGGEKSKNYLHEVMGFKKENILLYSGLSPEQIVEKLISMNQGRLFDFTLDFVGKTMKQVCLQATAHSGHFATIVPEDGSFQVPVWERGISIAFGRNLSLHFIFVGAESFSGSPESWAIYSRHLGHITELINAGILHAPKIEILGNLSPETVSKAHQMLESGKAKGKLVMRISE